jgi:hypothetical protein
MNRDKFFPFAAFAPEPVVLVIKQTSANASIMKTFIPLVWLLLIVSLTVKAQYRSDRPLEMSFEQSGFFFSPSFLNPLGAEDFQRASVLTSDDPLHAIQRNPANLSRFDRDTLSGNYLYLDFRNNRQVVEQGYHGYRLFDYSYPRYGWGYYHTTKRDELNPLVSVAYLTRLPVLDNSLSIGVTYQLINQAEKYYAIPRDIYRNLAGKDNFGVAYEGVGDYEIEDRYSASDDMYHEGHAINAFLAWEVTNAFQVGLKAGKFLFDRQGSFGSDNLWNERMDYYSYWKKHEDRMQDYGHWDYSLGLKYAFHEGSRLGLYAGLVTGDVVQGMDKDDESVSRSGERGTSRWSDYQSWHTTDQQWDHSGNTVYSGLQWNKKLKQDLHLRLMYNFSRLSQDLGLGSSIESESDNEYYSESSDYLYESEGYSNMFDDRNGDGERTISNHTIQSALNWQVVNEHHFSVGLIMGFRNQRTNTSEKVDAFSETYRYYHNIYNGNEHTHEYYRLTEEDKTINWKFRSHLRYLQIPVMYQYDINPRFDLLVWINRTMNFWKIENTTLVLYDYRRRVENNETLIETMTGERISEPDERISATNTNFLVGITFSPVSNISVQFLASPGIEDHSLVDKKIRGTQYWLNIRFKP